MDLKHLVMLALQLSILATVFGFGLRATVKDVLYLIRNPSLLGRSVVAMFVIMPLVALALVRAFHLEPRLEIALICISIAPLPPIIPKKLAKAGGHPAYGLALTAVVALFAVVFVPVASALLGRFFGQPFAMGGGAIARVMLLTIVLPLAAGMIVRATLPAVADRIERPIALIGGILLPVAVIALVGANLSAIWAHVGGGTVLAIASFVVIGLGVGHLLGGPDPDGRVVLAISTACRHPAVVLAIATANYPTESFVAVILLYLLVGAFVCKPYIVWQRRAVSAKTPGNFAGQIGGTE
jgi:bile acid:Na+ symporter, BASS family